MEFIRQFITTEDAIWLMNVIAIFIIPPITSKLQNVNWPGTYKMAVAISFCIVIGTLQAYAEGKLNEEYTIIKNISFIFMFSQLVYQTLFKQYGWERYINSKAAVLTYASEQVKQEVAKLSDTEAQKILDPSDKAALDVQLIKHG